jgi:hypothetical protein
MGINEELRAALGPLAEAIPQLTAAVHAMADEQTTRDAEVKKALTERAIEVQTALSVRGDEGREFERKQIKRTRVILAGMTLVVLGSGALTYNAITGRTILRNVQSVTSPTAVAQQQKATAALLSNFEIELDCRSRRQQARLPAPDPSKPCIAQTDPSVFPGVLGQPGRPGD